VLKRLCRDGIVQRTVHKADPPANVSYSLTPLGCGLAQSASGLLQWLSDNLHAIELSREINRLRNADSADADDRV
jgi:DNA-binding HxlR family transcriptional regulator